MRKSTVIFSFFVFFCKIARLEGIMSFYENCSACCRRHGTSLGAVMAKIGKSSGSPTAWKKGASAKIDVVADIANYLGVSIDELVYGPERMYSLTWNPLQLTEEQSELLQVFDRIPPDKHQLCIDFLKTHVAEPEKEEEGKRA